MKYTAADLIEMFPGCTDRPEAIESLEMLFSTLEYVQIDERMLHFLMLDLSNAWKQAAESGYKRGYIDGQLQAWREARDTIKRTEVDVVEVEVFYQGGKV
ncbi:hypothetical protein Bhz51_00159 [Stenotrophomonas phage vB_SmaM_Bhz51]|nr:hypothetical protein [Stenotrophomonas phage BUCT608]QYC97383.1 hypothetical protein [Stenotrophomonas phage BUCT608]